MNGKYRLLAAGSAVLLFLSGASVAGILLRSDAQSVKPTMASAAPQQRVQVVRRTRVRHVTVRPKRSRTDAGAAGLPQRRPAVAVAAQSVQPVSQTQPKPTSRTSPGAGGDDEGGEEADDHDERGEHEGGDDD